MKTWILWAGDLVATLAVIAMLWASVWDGRRYGDWGRLPLALISVVFLAMAWAVSLPAFL